MRKNRTRHSSTHRPPHAPPPSRIASCHHTQNKREARTTRGEQDNAKVPAPIRTRGITAHTTTAIQQGHQTNETGRRYKHEGDTTRRQGGTPSQYPPFIRHATPRRHATPPSAMPPPTTNVRGEQTQDTPPHKDHRQILITRTPPTHQATRQCTTRQQY